MSVSTHLNMFIETAIENSHLKQSLLINLPSNGLKMNSEFQFCGTIQISHRRHPDSHLLISIFNLSLTAIIRHSLQSLGEKYMPFHYDHLCCA